MITEKEKEVLNLIKKHSEVRPPSYSFLALKMGVGKTRIAQLVNSLKAKGRISNKGLAK